MVPIFIVPGSTIATARWARTPYETRGLLLTLWILASCQYRDEGVWPDRVTLEDDLAANIREERVSIGPLIDLGWVRVDPSGRIIVQDWREWQQRAAPSGVTGVRVYVCYDWTGDVIYVGRTSTGNRFAAHRQQSPWWDEVANIRERKCASFADSLVLEAMLIRRHQPRYNVEGVSR